MHERVNLLSILYHSLDNTRQLHSLNVLCSHMEFSHWTHPIPLQDLDEVRQSFHQDGPENRGSMDSLCCRFLQHASYFSVLVQIHHVSDKSTTASCYILEHPERESGCLENIMARVQDNQCHIRLFSGF